MRVKLYFPLCVLLTLEAKDATFWYDLNNDPVTSINPNIITINEYSLLKVGLDNGSLITTLGKTCYGGNLVLNNGLWVEATFRGKITDDATTLYYLNSGTKSFNGEGTFFLQF